MARIVNLDDLVPDDIEFRYRGKSYPIPGDISVEDTFKLIRLLEQAVEAENGADADERERVNLEVKAALTDLFRIRTPDLEALPFGTIAFQHVLSEVLTALGLQVVQKDEPEDPPTPGRKRPKPKPPSRPSTGSRK